MYDKLLAELKRLVEAGKESDFKILLNRNNLSKEEDNIASLLNEAINNYRNSMEYTLMKYKLTSSALNIALWDMDVVSKDVLSPDNKISWSQEFRNMLGFTDENDFPNILSSWSGRLHPKDRDRTFKAFTAHIKDTAGKTPYSIEYRLMMKDGNYRFFHAFGTTLRDEKGKPIRVAGALEDINEKKMLENEIERKNEFNHVLFNAAPAGLTVFDENFNPIDCNNAALQIFACMEKEYFLNNYWEVFSPVYQPDGRRSIEKAAVIKTNAFSTERTNFEWMHRTLNGEQLPVESTLTPFYLNEEKFIISFYYDLRRIKKMEKEIQHLEVEAEKIYYDALTGIYNRRFFDENIVSVIRALSRSGGALGLMMIDIDFFKTYNDTYGHSEGDNCLRIIAETLSKTITRTDDFAVRYGGEEFVVVLPNTNEYGVRLVAEKLLKNIQDLNIPHEKSNVANCVTISIGAITGKPEHNQNAEDYIKRADEMMYISKQNGRNRYTFSYF